MDALGFLEPDPLMIPEDGRWIAECPVCGQLSIGETGPESVEDWREHRTRDHHWPPSQEPGLRGDDLLRALVDPYSDEHSWCIAAVADYFHGNEFEGRRFERLGRPGGNDPEPDHVTTADLVAVSMLGIEVPPRAALAILEELANPIGSLLAEIPHTPLHRATEHVLARQQPAWDLYDLLTGIPGLAQTKVSKIMARKRPHLIPVHDRRVTYRLELKGDEWAAHRRWWTTPGHVEAIREMRRRVGRIDDISLLRVLDVAVWRYDRYLRPQL